MQPKDRTRQRKATKGTPVHARHQVKVGYMEPMRDAFADVRAACNDFFRTHGLDAPRDFTYGANQFD